MNRKNTKKICIDNNIFTDNNTFFYKFLQSEMQQDITNMYIQAVASKYYYWCHKKCYSKGICTNWEVLYMLIIFLLLQHFKNQSIIHVI